MVVCFGGLVANGHSGCGSSSCELGLFQCNINKLMQLVNDMLLGLECNTRLLASEWDMLTVAAFSVNTVFDPFFTLLFLCFCF